MKKYILAGACFWALFLTAFNGQAQSTDQAQEKEEIILKKDGTFPDDVTIQIKDGKVTINGKEANDIEIIRRKSSGDDLSEGSFSGDRRMFSPNRRRGGELFGSSSQGQAFLGVVTLNDDQSSGAQIEQVEHGTPADSAGLEKGDVITKVNDETISSPQDLSKLIRSFDPGEEITITYQRDGKTQETHVQLGRLDNSMGFNFPGNRSPFGMGRVPESDKGMMDWFRRNHPGVDRNPNMSTYNQGRPHLGLTVEELPNQEVSIIRVLPESTAEEAGFKPNDKILRIDGKAIKSVQGLQEIIKANWGNDHIKARVDRKGEVVDLEFSLPDYNEQADL